ncbi:hypothetical protein [Coleofasciculus sp. F4-SAH-05]|uniref:hypothetical protein n=1 Tax=Coleofasciculus TaxID=669368 RepID=UPI0032F1116F
MIHAGVSELEQAFQSHLAAVRETNGTASYLLLFYATECGLKRIWLRRKELQTTDQIQDQKLKNGHKLDRWIKELGIPASEVEAAPRFSLERDGSNLDIGKAHEVWRYGIEVKSEHEENLVNWLESVCDWINREIQQ